MGSRDHPAVRPLPKHGTFARYLRYKCKCALCRAKWSEYQKAYRARKKEGRGGVRKDLTGGG